MKHTKKFSFLCGIIAFLSFASVQSVQAQDDFNITQVVINSCQGTIDISVQFPQGHNITYQWYEQDTAGAYVLMNGETFPSLIDIQPGFYKVEVTNETSGEVITGEYQLNDSFDLVLRDLFSGLVCNTDPNSGAILIYFDNGLKPYEYELYDSTNNLLASGTTSGVDRHASFKGLTAGQYTLNWVDFFGCTGTEVIDVETPPALDATISKTDALCFNGTGELNFSINGGWGPEYKVQLTQENGNTVTLPGYSSISTLNGAYFDVGVGQNISLTGLAAGVYTLSYFDQPLNKQFIDRFSFDVTDIGFCTRTLSVEIEQPDQLVATATLTDVSCFGGTDGSISVTIAGGTAPYTITNDLSGAVANVATDGGSFDFIGLTAGTYNYTIEDANGCTIEQEYIIDQPTQLILALNTSTDVSCNGGNDGSIVVEVDGGTPGYVFSINGTPTTPSSVTGNLFTFSGLAAAAYTLTVTDTNGCASDLPKIDETITEPQPITHTINDFALSCFDDANGSIAGTISGGTAPYTITDDLSGVAINVATDGGSFNFTGLTAGNYTFTITDANSATGGAGCTATATASVTQPDQLVATATLTDVSCFGGTDGSISVTIAGGTAPYTITNDLSGAVANVATDGGSFDFIGLTAGTYNYTIEDANGCTIEQEYIIDQPTQLILALNTSTDVSCNGGNDGSIVVEVDGGTPGYVFSINGTPTTPSSVTGNLFTFSGLAAAAYTLTVTDTNGCASDLPKIDETITEPQPITHTINDFALSCFDDANGSIAGTISGGTAPYTITDDLSGVAINVATDGGSFNFTGLTAGNYTFTITDANSATGGAGCTATATASVTQPDQLVATATLTDVSCFGGTDGSISVTIASGTAPYTITNDLSGVVANVATDGGSFDFIGLTAGTYNYTIEDANGCTIEQEYIIDQPATLGLTSTVSTFSSGTGNAINISCNGANDGFINITPTGGASPFTYQWTTSNGGVISGLSTDQNQTELVAGDYEVTITDFNNCQTTGSFSLVEPRTLSGNAAVTQDNECFDGTLGSIEANINGTGSVDGISYTYVISGANLPSGYTSSISGIQLSQQFNNLPAGTYAITVTDENNCSFTSAPQTITQPSNPITASETISSFNGFGVSCSDSNNAAIILSVSGGTPYTDSNGNSYYDYQWSSSTGSQIPTGMENASNISGVGAGDYTVVITDSTGSCSITATYTITEPDDIALSGTTSDYNGFQVSAFGDDDGSIDLTVTGGVDTQAYDYLWTASLGGTVPAGQETLQDPNGLTAGTYQVLVTDANGCTETLTFVLNEPNELLVSENIGEHQNIDCFGESTGIIQIDITQGSVPPYEFTLTQGATTVQTTNINNTLQRFENLPAGTYDAVVTDANGTEVTVSSIVLSQPASGLAIGSATISDFNGFGISCFNADNGTIDLVVNGGTSPYSYNWNASNGVNLSTVDAPNLNNLAPGDYTVVITDSTGSCSITATYTITEPDDIALSGTTSDYNGFQVSAFGNDDGSIDLTVIGGVDTQAYDYLWTASLGGTVPAGQETLQDPNGLTAGTYQVLVTDANGCTETLTFVLNEPNELLVSENIGEHQNIDCFGESTGIIQIDITQGSVPPYEFTLTQGATTVQTTNINNTLQRFENLPAGTYDAVVTDANGTEVTVSSIVLSQPASGLAIGSATISDFNGFGISCFNADNGTIDLVVNGGTSPYSYNWNASNGVNLSTVDAPNLNNLAPGDYTVVITDSTGSCSITATYTITEPDDIALSGTTSDYNGFQVSAFGNDDGSIDLTVIGGVDTQAYDYLWTASLGGTVPAGQETLQDPNGLTAGTYQVLVTDANGCTETLTFVLNEPNELLVSENIGEHQNIDCFGESTGIIQIDITQGSVPPYEFTLTQGATTVQTTNINNTLQRFENLPAGTYDAVVTDANGTEVTVSSIVLSQPASGLAIGSATISDFNGFGISCFNADNGTIDLVVNGGTSPYSYNWNASNGVNLSTVDAPNLNNLAPGDYTVVITDSTGSCSITATYTITEPDDIALSGTTSDYNGFQVSAFGDDDGSIDLTVIGGVDTQAYDYLWTASLGGTVPAGQETLQDPNGLTAGTYQVLVTDANGCTETLTFVLNEPNELLVSENIGEHQNIDCFGESTGIIQIDITQGSVPPYEFTLTQGATTVQTTNINNTLQRFENLPAGTYDAVVTDANGTEVTVSSIVLSQPASGLAIGSATISDFNGFGISCFNADNGTIDLVVNGGTSPYSYNWNASNGVNLSTVDAPNLNNLAPGDYTVVITDSTGSCSITATYTITEPDDIALSGTTSDYNGFQVSAFGNDDGSIDLTVIGGVGTQAYDYLWTASLGGTVPAGQETLQDPNGLTAGTYQVLVTDANGCTETLTFVLNEPNELLVSENIGEHQNIDCFGESTGIIQIDITQGSVPPYEFTLTQGATTVQTTNINNTLQRFENLPAGTYDAVVTDANGTEVTVSSIVLSQPASGLAIGSATISDFNGFGISCFNADNGTIDLVVNGGTSPYSYNWNASNGVNLSTVDAPNLNNLAPGDYTVVITDSTGSCSITATYTITEPDDIALSGTTSDYNGFQVSAFGDDDGSIDLTVIGGVDTQAYDYLWTASLGGTVPAGQETLQDPNGLTAGTYQVLVTDANGCTETLTFVLNEPNELLVSENIGEHQNIDCFGESTGIIQIDITQGSVPPYEFTLTQGATTVQTTNINNTLQRFENLPAGTYDAVVTDANGTEVTVSSIVLSQPANPFEASITTSTYAGPNGTFELSCFGSSEGTIDVVFSGGTPFDQGLSTAYYNYTLTDSAGTVIRNGQGTTISEVNLVADTYTLNAVDATGKCVVNELIVLSQPDQIVINTDTFQDMSCFQANDGSIDVTISGGLGDYSYSWTKDGSAFATQEDLNGLEAGEYILLVDDANAINCFTTQTYTISEPAELQVSLNSKTDILCNGESTGAIDITVVGGTQLLGGASYQFNWVHDSGTTYTTEDITNIPAGTYDLVVVDANGCSESLQVVLLEPNPFLFNTTKTDISCYGYDDGTITISPVGGVAPYTITWSDLGNGTSRTNLSPDTYTVTLTDANNCTFIDTITIVEAPIFAINSAKTDISCFGAADGSIDLSIIGGVAPYQLLWSDDPSAGLERNNLAPGVYNVTVTGADNCIQTETFVINEPVSLGATALTTDAFDCTNPNSGAIDLTVTGGTLPYSFSWSNGATSEDLTAISAGVYTVTITDANGCQEVQNYTISRQDSLTANVVTTINANCATKDVVQINELFITGGFPPHSISWSYGNVDSTDPTIMRTGINGNAIATITDNRGCTTSVNVPVNLFTLGDPDFNMNASFYTDYSIWAINDVISFTNTSTGDTESFLWDFGDGTTSTDVNPTHTYVREGTYEISLTVTYPYGCVYTIQNTIKVGRGYELEIPNAFTPNEDGVNETFRPVYLGMKEVKLEIYDTWGGLLYSEYSTTNLFNGWDGTVDGKPAENGNYIYQVIATARNDLEITKTGSFVLIK